MAIILKLNPGESQSQLLARFKKQVKNERVIEEMRDRTEYKKPSQIRQEERKEKKRKIRKYARDIDKV